MKGHAVFQLLLLGSGPSALFLGGFIRTLEGKMTEFHVDAGKVLSQAPRTVDPGVIYQTITHDVTAAEKYSNCIKNLKCNVKDFAENIENVDNFLQDNNITHIWSQGNITSGGVTHWQIFMNAVHGLNKGRVFEMITDHNLASLRHMSDVPARDSYISSWDVKEHVIYEAKYVKQCIGGPKSQPELPANAPAMTPPPPQLPAMTPPPMMMPPTA